MISSLAWVPVGVADPHPKRYEMSTAEQELIRLMEEQGGLDEIEANLHENLNKETPEPAPDASGLPADLRMDEYSSDEGGEEMGVGNLLVGKETVLTDDMLPEDKIYDEDDEGDDDEGVSGEGDEIDGISDAESDNDDDDDLQDVPDTREFSPIDVEGLESMGFAGAGGGMRADMERIDDDDSEADQVELTDDDAVVVVAKTEDDFASLEVHVYDTKSGNLYVHHDIPLPSFPLCLAHGQVSSGGATGNFCAVGTFSPGIEIWNLDVLNALEPSCILGGEDTSAADDVMKLRMIQGARGKNPDKVHHQLKNKGLRHGSHTDAVMSLSWNAVHQQVLASGSADCTVKLWDVTQAGTDEKSNAATFTHHKGKVQSVVWHPREATLLATGSYDRTVALLDARGSGDKVKKVRLKADVEAMSWDPFHPEYLTVASEDGTLSCWDVRKFDTSKPLWSFVANEYGVTDLTYSAHVPGLFATSSVDKTVTLWDAYSQDAAPSKSPPRSCGSKDMCSGKLYTVGFYPSRPWLLGCGGSGNLLALWDLSDESAIRQRFKDRSSKTESDPPKEVEANTGDFDAMMSEKGDHRESADDTKAKKKSKPKGKRKAHRRG